MRENWEFTDTETMLSYLVGESYGPNAQTQIPRIRREKQEMAQLIIDATGMNSDHIALEIGSGCGFLSSYVAPRVQRLFCCDISQSFLDVAKKECENFPNASFHRVSPGSLSFLPENSIDIAYSFNVFIHLNLFDINHYFQELNRVVRPEGKVWFDFCVADKFIHEGVPDMFFEMSAYYKTYPNKLSGMMQWHSYTSIQALAQRHGFYFDLDKCDDNCVVLTRQMPNSKSIERPPLFGQLTDNIKNILRLKN